MRWIMELLQFRYSAPYNTPWLTNSCNGASLRHEMLCDQPAAALWVAVALHVVTVLILLRPTRNSAAPLLLCSAP